MASGDLQRPEPSMAETTRTGRGPMSEADAIAAADREAAARSARGVDTTRKRAEPPPRATLGGGEITAEGRRQCLDNNTCIAS